MGVADFSVRRPVTIIMFFLGILLFGLISWIRLPQELYPPITYPQLSVITFYKDAAPEEIEVLITKPVEEAVGTVSGVRRISSSSKEETSLVMAEFNWGTNMDFAALGVREKMDLIKESLPRGSEDPIVIKYNPFELPLMVLNITADKTTPSELVSIVKKLIKNEIEKADGVAACNITGGLIPEVLVEINQDRLASKQVALNEVVEAINKANLNYPAGTIEESFYEYLIRTIGEFKLVKEIDDVAVGIDDKTKKSEYAEFGPEDVKQKEARAITDKRLILLKDIAKIKETFKEKTSVSRYNGKDNISVSIQKQADANTLRVANSVRAVLSRLKKVVPKDVHIDIVYDQSAFIKSAIAGVASAAWQGGLLAFLVLFFFLKNARSAAVITITIPISIFSVFALMYFSNITLNMISLGGLALGVGMLVDAGIVVVENIYRYREEERKEPKEAAVLGTNEVSLAVGGSVLTTIVVFLPMIFVVGIAGQLFKELAFTVTFSLLTSWLVAMTLIPILSAGEKKPPDVSYDDGQKGVQDIILGFLYKVNRTALNFFLNFKLLCIGLVLVIFLIACLLIPALDAELLPKIDQGQFIIKMTLPSGTRLTVTDKIAKVIESHLLKMKEVESVTVNIGSTKEKKGTALLETMGANEGQVIVNLKPLASWLKGGENYRTASTADIVQRLRNLLQQESLSNANLEYVLQESVFKSAFQAGAPVVIEVKGQDMIKLRNITQDTKKMLKTIPGIYSIKDSIIESAPEVKVNVFKEKAATYNLSTNEIALTAQTAIKGYTATKFKKEGEEIDIRACLRKQDRDNLLKVTRLMIHSPLGVNIPLAELCYFNLGKGPTEIKRQDQQRVVVITANIYKKSFKAVANTITSRLKLLKLSSGYSAELKGEKEEMQESFNSLFLALAVSVILVFMVMASQFESLWQPFIIMLTIPLSIIGVVFGLFITHTPLSIMVGLGFIILGGIVVNNAIVLIDYINILRKEHGYPAKEAVILASNRRLRPILMTSLTTILGLVPLALAIEEGSKLQRPMAITVMGGLTVAMFLSLVFIPTVYLACEEILVYIRSRIFGIKVKEDKTSKPQKGIGAAEEPRPIMPLAVVPEVSEKIPGPVEETKPQKDAIPPPAEALKQTEEKPILLPEPPKEEIKQPQEPAPSLEKKKEESGRGGISLKIWDSLTQRQRELIRYLRENRKISRKEYSEKFNISVPTAARDIKTLSDQGILVGKGPAAVGRYYFLNEGM